MICGVFFLNRQHLFHLRSESSGFITNAARYYQEQKYQEAALEFRNALQANAEDTEAHLGLARSLLRLGFAEEAVQSYRKAVELDPKLYTAHLELGRLAYATGSVDLALQEATTAAHLKPDKPEPRLLLALIYRRTGQDNLAGEQYRTILGKNPADRETRHLLITMLQTKRRYVEAAREAEAGLAVSPGDTDLQVALARALEGQGRSGDAAALLRTAGANDLTSPAPFLILGDLQVRKGEFIPAIRSYEEALKRSPGNTGVMNNIALLIANHGYELDRAAELASTLYTKYPKDPAVVDTMGWVLFRQGKVDQALPLLRMAAAGMPLVPAHRYHLGVVLLKTGNQAAGLRELETALTLSKDFDGADQARAILASVASQRKRSE